MVSPNLGSAFARMTAMGHGPEQQAARHETLSAMRVLFALISLAVGLSVAWSCGAPSDDGVGHTLAGPSTDGFPFIAYGGTCNPGGFRVEGACRSAGMDSDPTDHEAVVYMSLVAGAKCSLFVSGASPPSIVVTLEPLDGGGFYVSPAPVRFACGN